MASALLTPSLGTASSDSDLTVIAADLVVGDSNLRSAFAKLSVAHQQLILGLRVKRTTVAAFAAERKVPATVVRRELRVAMLLLADADPAPPFGQNGGRRRTNSGEPSSPPSRPPRSSWTPSAAPSR